MNLNLPIMRLAQIPDGRAGVEVTLNLMRAYVRQFRKTPLIRGLALDNVAHLPQKIWMLEIQAQFDFVRNNIRYVGDVKNVETLQDPFRTLQLGQGDCDDFCVLLASLLNAIDYDCRFVACGREKGIFEHVYVQCELPNRRRTINLDATEPHPMGWQPDGMADWFPIDIDP